MHHLAFALSQATFHQAVERLDERGIRHSGVKDRGFMDSIYFEDPLGLLIELASYRFEPPVGYTHADVLLEAHKLRVERDDYNIAQEHLADAIETLVARSRASLSDDRSPKNPTTREEHMASNTLSILKPSVNNLTVRIFVRAAGLDFEEIDVWGKKGTHEFLRQGPRRTSRRCSRRTGCRGARSGRAARSCSTSATSTGSTSFYPTDPAERAMVDSAMFYLIGTLYPFLARATYPALGFPQYAGEVGASDADDDAKARAQAAAEAALAGPLEVYRAFFLDGRRSSAATRRRSPTSGSPRRSSSCARSTTSCPAWAEEYMAAMESALGDAYTEPAADVRGYIASVKAPTTA